MYNGSWHKDNIHGIGVFRFSNGSIYKRKFENVKIDSIDLESFSGEDLSEGFSLYETLANLFS
jgi:hypothetical protein